MKQHAKRKFVVDTSNYGVFVILEGSLEEYANLLDSIDALEYDRHIMLVTRFEEAA